MVIMSSLLRRLYDTPERMLLFKERYGILNDIHLELAPIEAPGMVTMTKSSASLSCPLSKGELDFPFTQCSIKP